MSQIKITTLTPVHIGSGNFLQYNSEFVPFQHKGQHYLGIIDERKILELIGVEHLNDWVLSIERNDSTATLVQRYAPQCATGDYLKRMDYSFADAVKPSDTLKECMHTGMGIPYIPGSSLKGAIRTDITATLAKRHLPASVDGWRLKGLAADMESRLFGKDPTANIFRFIQVGDAHFERNCEIVLRLIMSLNIRHNTSRQPDSNNRKPQLVEAIAAEEAAACSLKIDTSAYRRARYAMQDMGNLPEEIQTLQGLFQLVNAHTVQLIAEEIQFWQQVSHEKTGADVYIENMQTLLDTARQCGPDSCVLRLGHTSGWRFITGAWGEHLGCFAPGIVNLARPNNEKKYSEYDFPKSRRTDADGDLLGFVQLSL